MENLYFQWENPLEMVMFNSYVQLPEGNGHDGNSYGRTNRNVHGNTLVSMGMLMGPKSHFGLENDD